MSDNLHDLVGALYEIDSELKALETTKKELKASIQAIVESLPDQRAEVPGVGTVLMTKAGTTVSYDADALESLTSTLLQSVELRTAQALADCRKESNRNPSLQFRSKKG